MKDKKLEMLVKRYRLYKEVHKILSGLEELTGLEGKIINGAIIKICRAKSEIEDKLLNEVG